MTIEKDYRQTKWPGLPGNAHLVRQNKGEGVTNLQRSVTLRPPFERFKAGNDVEHFWHLHCLKHLLENNWRQFCDSNFCHQIHWMEDLRLCFEIKENINELTQQRSSEFTHYYENDPSFNIRLRHCWFLLNSRLKQEFIKGHGASRILYSPSKTLHPSS